MNSIEVLKKADGFIQAEQAENAHATLVKFLNDTDNPHVWRKLSRVYQLLGDEIAARAILRNIIYHQANPHILDIIAARLPVSKPLSVERLNLLYYSIPKCGSSSIKDAILMAVGQESRGGASHSHAEKFAKLLSFKEIDQQYANTQSIAVIRRPEDRIRSYWQKNVKAEGTLRNEAGFKETFYGLETLPSYKQILQNFEAYRRVFRDFRHHTDSLIGYLGRSPKRFTRIFDVSEVDQAIEMIGQLANLDLPKINIMKSPNNGIIKHSRKIIKLEQSVVQKHYAEELSVYY